MYRESTFKELVMRIIITALVIAIAAFFTIGFKIDGIAPLLTASIVIALLDYLVQRLFSKKASPFGRGLGGFVITVIILLITSKLVNGFDIKLLSAIIAAVMIGVVDILIPGGSL